MWQTPQGIRVLHGPEALLFQTGVLLVYDQIEDVFDIAELDISTGIPIYDALEPKAKCIALASIAKGLLTTYNQYVIPITDWHQATILAVFQTLKTKIQVEIGLENHFDIRQQIKNVYLQDTESFGEYDTVIDIEYDSYNEWEIRLNAIASKIVDSEISTKISTNGPLISDKSLIAAQKYLQGLRRGN